MTEAIVTTYHRHELNALVCLGGGGTQKNALRLKEAGFNVVTLPKTIDNDIALTDQSFGFDTAVSIATEAIDRLHSTAISHNRIIVVEVMGHRAGWLALEAGIAGRVDVILNGPVDHTIKLKRHLEELTKQESRLTILGHLQRGGVPSAADRVLATRLGTSCAEVLKNEEYGVMLAIQGEKIKSVPLEDVVRKKKFVPVDHPLIQAARLVGTRFGD